MPHDPVCTMLGSDENKHPGEGRMLEECPLLGAADENDTLVDLAAAVRAGLTSWRIIASPIRPLGPFARGRQRRF
jgi:hypothetical protein